MGVKPEELEALGESAVRAMVERGELGAVDSPRRNEVEVWLKAKAFERTEAREEESLSIARMAFRNSNRANTIAIMAFVLAIIAMIIAAVAAKDQIIWLLQLAGLKSG